MKLIGTIKQDEDGTTFYFKGRTKKLHRTAGPAVIYADGYQAYYIDGKYLTPEEFALRSAPCAGKTVEIDGQKYKLTPV